ncbi:hypothetical protein ACT3SP_14565 [Brachybacterium sp. AOP43-C2-M15]|uniref:hypothetical protein n=1 Tax=Brachybacterium sp. AOP43-C2-M15 TaxID=3457661 RepID=UPI004033E2AF
MGARGTERRVLSRRAFAGAAALAAAGALGACTGDDSQVDLTLIEEPPASTVLPGEDLASTALTLSAALFESADTAVVATEESVEELAGVSAGSGLPLLVGTGRPVVEELSRLGARTVITVAGTELGTLGEDVEVLEHGAEGVEIPEAPEDAPSAAVTLFVDPELGLPAQPVAAALVRAAGGAVVEMPGGDVGRSGDTVDAVTEATGEDPARGVLALGTSFGPADAWADTLRRTTTVPQLPGGGTTVFPGRRMIAAYGTPGIPSLGILGEQELEETITRVQELVAEYQDLTEEPVIPAFEIISTIASSDAGSDGDFSAEVSPESLRDWVDAAGEAGVYVVLDLQPGTTDFLTQATLYEDLLTAPHVGLALDPEWRLRPGQKHLEQIGSVTAAEVNEVSTWLADLTAEHSLPQKVLILHQFTHSMITDRQDLDVSRPELAITLHADGHGVPGDKLGTYRALQQDLPEGVAMAWKNFYDEDTPLFTPEETYDVAPRPWFVSYQ